MHLIDSPYDGKAGNPVGPHVSYYVEDIAGAEQEVEARGLVTFAMGEGKDRIVWLTDPAGNTVELQQDPER